MEYNGVRVGGETGICQKNKSFGKSECLFSPGNKIRICDYGCSEKIIGG